MLPAKMATHEVLREAWSQVLDIDEQEIDDASDFVELGGDSVTAIKLAGIAPDYGIILEAETIFEEPTFSGMLAKTKLSKAHATVNGVDSLVATDADLIQTCARECNLSATQIEDVFPAGAATSFFFTAHQASGGWLLQLVFELSSEINTPLACKAFETIHERN